MSYTATIFTTLHENTGRGKGAYATAKRLIKEQEDEK